MHHPLAPKAYTAMMQAEQALHSTMEREYGWRKALRMRGRSPSEQDSAAVVAALVVLDAAMKAYAGAVETDAAMSRLLTRSEP